ncbi:MAG TPA: hypothetical protein VJ860_06090 [Polyangia bacterium]|nr:hypothetical protein [Polyangia bacterium]
MVRCGGVYQQGIAIEGEAAREHGDIVEVLHAAVGHAELHHGLELFGDDGLTRVGTQARRREVKERWELDDHCLRRDRIAEADVDLKPHLSVRHARDDLGTHAAVLLVLPDEADRERGEVEVDAVVDHFVCEHLREDLAHVLHARVSEAKEVEIAGCSVGFAGPEREERGTFEHELLCMPGCGEAEQQAFARVPSEHQLEVLAPLAGQAQKASAHGGTDVRGRLLLHASASRYGRMNA